MSTQREEPTSMDRSALDRLTLEQLQEEAARYKIPSSVKLQMTQMCVLRN
ncbi:hypothetical protein EAI_17382 [Harpegnathos saltator]|uniref:Uncharacterized protein n=1 Tax=Harpegnathos saltator TaxID=610380 RepID=E2BQZ2_HARSA|nr:hypothetical protein EAI_17382 [Harpegnathos saltator]